VFILSGFGFIRGAIASYLREALSYRVAPRVTAPPPAVPTRHSSGRAKAARPLSSALSSSLWNEPIIQKLRALFLLVFLLIPMTLSAGQRAPQELSQLFEKSKYVLIGEVEAVTLLQDRGLNGREYEVEIVVITSVKGSPSAQRIKIPTYIGGVKGFDVLLKPKQKGVFFLRSIDNGIGRLTHWGAVALFEESYFK